MQTYKIIATGMQYLITVARIRAMSAEAAIKIYKISYPKDKASYIAFAISV